VPILLTTRAILGTLLLTAAAVAQSTPPQNPPPAPCPASTPNQQQDQTAKPCTPAHPKSAAEQFPFPGSPAKPATPQPATPDKPDTPAPSTTPSDAATQHPFPTTPAPKLPDSDSSSSSSNDDPDATPQPPTSDDTVHPSRHKLPKVKKVQTDDERVDEDIYVAKFYMNDENYQGAYLRAKDAITVQPDYALGHFTLAQVLQKMKKQDEAIAEYQLYLKLDPDGEKAKAAKQALAQLK
jgi:tetratricopeptide (TPR) repeat protein